MTVIGFFCGGLLLLSGVYLFGDKRPLAKWGELDAWPYVVGMISGLLAAVLLWWLMKANIPNWMNIVALLIPLALATVIGSWRIWSDEGWVGPILSCIVPLVALASYASRGGLPQGAAVSLLVLATPLLAGTAWYLNEWSNPSWRSITVGEFAQLAQRMPDNESLGRVSSNIDAKELEGSVAMGLVAQILGKRHFKQMLPRTILALGAFSVSIIAWNMLPAMAWLAVVISLVGAIPPSIYWWRSRGTSGARHTYLGVGAILYDILALLPVLVLVIQSIRQLRFL